MNKTLLYVSIREAKPNPMFTEEQRQSIRFLVYNRPVACAECGRKAKTLWTMLCQFKCIDMESSDFEAKPTKNSHAPLTPVCGEHPIAPDFG